MIKCGIDSLGFSISEPQQCPSPAVVPFNENPAWASSSVGRTPDWQSGCRGFDSHLCPHYFGISVQLEWMPPCHGGDHGFESHISRFHCLTLMKRVKLSIHDTQWTTRSTKEMSLGRVYNRYQLFSGRTRSHVCKGMGPKNPSFFNCLRSLIGRAAGS